LTNGLQTIVRHLAEPEIAVGSVISAVIGCEAAPEGVSPIAMQSQVTADRFLSPIALIPADDQQLGLQASSHRFRSSDKGFLPLSVC
jgi:hypothetical protein